MRRLAYRYLMNVYDNLNCNELMLDARWDHRKLYVGGVVIVNVPH